MSRWLRHYAGLCRDEKLVRVAIRSKQTIERVVWVWCAILESAAEVNDNGRYDFDIGEASYFLRADESDVGGIVDALEGLGRLCEGRVAHWADRQFQSDTSAERQKRYRDRKKTGDGHNGDGQVTASSRHGDAPDTDTDTDIRPSILKPARAEEKMDEDALRDWERFDAAFPWSPGMSKPKAKAVFVSFGSDDRKSALAGIPALKSAKPTTYPLAADKYLSERRFESCAPSVVAATVFVAKDTPEWMARVAAGHKPGLVTTSRVAGRVIEGWAFPTSPVGVEQRALGAA